MKSKKTNVHPLRTGADALVAFVLAQTFGGPRDRQYTGQDHTFLGKRGRLSVNGRTFRDVGDAIHDALAYAAKSYAPTLRSIDLEAIVGEALCRLETDDRHHPGDDAVTLKDYGACPTCRQPSRPR